MYTGHAMLSVTLQTLICTLFPLAMVVYPFGVAFLFQSMSQASIIDSWHHQTIHRDYTMQASHHRLHFPSVIMSQAAQCLASTTHHCLVCISMHGTRTTCTTHNQVFGSKLTLMMCPFPLPLVARFEKSPTPKQLISRS